MPNFGMVSNMKSFYLDLTSYGTNRRWNHVMSISEVNKTEG